MNTDDTFNTITFLLQLTWIPYDQTLKEMTLTVKVVRTGTISDLISEINKLIGHEMELIVTQVHNSYFHKFFGEEDTLESIYDTDEIYV